MTAVIHHPYFLPWLGYFSKLSFADKFVVLDDLKFSKGFYYDRTRYVNVSGDVKWLSIPIGQNFGKTLNEITVPNKEFSKKFIKTIESSYARADYYVEWKSFKHLFIECINSDDNLVKINLNFTTAILSYLNIKIPDIFYSSTIDKYIDKTERLVGLCKRIDCDSILIGDGSSLREHNWHKVKASGISVFLQEYNLLHPTYKQIRRQKIGFAKGVSILDSILNVGKIKTKEFLTSNLYQPKHIF